MVEIRHEQASLSAATAVTRDAFYFPRKAADFFSSGHEAQPGIASNIAPGGLTKCIMKTFPQPQSCGKTLCCNGSHYKTPQYCQGCLVSDQLDIGALRCCQRLDPLLASNGFRLIVRVSLRGWCV